MYLQKIDRTYICIEPFMPALMKVFPYITAHYRSGIHVSNTAWTALIRYRGNIFTGYFYSQNDQRESEVWPKSSQNFQLKLKKLWIRKLFIIWNPTTLVLGKILFEQWFESYFKFSKTMIQKYLSFHEESSLFLIMMSTRLL